MGLKYMKMKYLLNQYCLSTSGTGFGTTPSDVQVTVGYSVCAVTTVTDTSVRCALGAHKAGQFPVEVLVHSKGKATGSLVFEYEFTLDSIDPQSGEYLAMYLVST